MPRYARVTNNYLFRNPPLLWSASLVHRDFRGCLIRPSRYRIPTGTMGKAVSTYRIRRGLVLELKDYLRVLRRNWIVIVTTVLIGILVSGAASLLVKPKYMSETKLFVALQNSASAAELQQGNVFTQARVQSYVKTVTTPAVLQPVIDSLG